MGHGNEDVIYNRIHGLSYEIVGLNTIKLYKNSANRFLITPK